MLDGLFPAHAGVIPLDTATGTFTKAFPRTRGGDPPLHISWDGMMSLFPAHAGVILSDVHLGAAEHTFPRTRGGDPKWSDRGYAPIYFSPHTRG